MKVIHFGKYIYLGYNKKSDIIKPIIIDGFKTTYVASIDGKIFNTKNNIHEMSKCNSNCGYDIVLLHFNGKRKTCYVHRLVATAFIKIPNKYIKKGYTYETLTVNHIDGNKKNNNVNNLEWNTIKENIIHANKNGLTNPRHGENHPFAKLTENDVHKICKKIQNNECKLRDIATEFNVNRKTIEKIYRRKSWVEISNKYDFSEFNKTRSVDKESLNRAKKLIINSNLSCKEISKITGISYSYIRYLSKAKN